VAEFIPFDKRYKVKIRLIEPDPAMVAQEFTALCVGYDPGGHGSYVLGQGHNRTRFRRTGEHEAVGPAATPRWEIRPEDLAKLPTFETNAERSARIAAEEKAKGAAKAADDGE
jgi:hypothetical protein